MNDPVEGFVVVGGNEEQVTLTTAMRQAILDATRESIGYHASQWEFQLVNVIARLDALEGKGVTGSGGSTAKVESQVSELQTFTNRAVEILNEKQKSEFERLTEVARIVNDLSERVAALETRGD